MPSFQRFCRNFVWLIGLSLALLLFQPWAIAQSANAWISPRQQDGNGGWISDRANLIDWSTERHLNRRINKLVGRTHAEMAIATLPQLEAGQSSRAFALNLFNAWGIGNRDTNNGVLLFISYADHRIEIITGSGLGDVLPDAAVSRFIQQEIVPAFRQQDYAKGITQGVNAIAQSLEAQLPSAIFPDWMPDGVVWIPWLLVVVGVGFTGVSTVRILVPSFRAVSVPVPTQGMDTQTFHRSSDTLAKYSQPRLIVKVFSPPASLWEKQISALFTQMLGSGWIAGIGLMYGFWQFVLMHPEAAKWQGEAIAWGVLGVASSAWFGWGLLVASRFLVPHGSWMKMLLALVMTALLAVFGAIPVYGMIHAWGGSALGVMVIVGLLGGLVWAIAIDSDLHWQQQRHYRSDRTGNPIQELSAQELESVLKPEEVLAQSMGKLEFRGWREETIAAPLTREQVYLIRRSDPRASVCAHCQSYAVEVSEQTVERKIETKKKINRKRKETVTSIKSVKQTVYTCHSCGCAFAYDQPETPAIASSNFSGDSFSGLDPSDRSTSSYDTSSYESSPSSDYGSSSSSDFGGGSSDGGGAGSDW